MLSSWKLGRLAGIDLYLHPTTALLMLTYGLMLGGASGVTLIVLVFGCILLHELGHALAARLYGIATQDITLYPIGGVARLDRMPRGSGPELVIALAGPAVNLAIAAMLVGLSALTAVVDPAGGPSLPSMFLVPLAWINLMLAAFNLVPAFPMDGGRVLRATLSGWVGRLRATEIAAGIGRLLAVAFGVWSLAHGDLMRVALAVFIYLAASSELARVRSEERPPLIPDPRGGGFWAAPPGYHWVSQGGGVWRLAPVVVTADRGSSRSWR